MKRHQHIAAFYLETLLLIAVFIAIILVLTRVFGISRSQSGDAKLLTHAVCLAQNAAEAVSAAPDEEALRAILNENDNAAVTEGGIRASYDRDMQPDADGELLVDVTWVPEGGLVSSSVTVWLEGRAEPVYTLDTASYKGEAQG